MRRQDRIAIGKQEVPLTVSVTSRSPAPTRGTTARHTYFPASSWRTDFRVSLFSLLKTWKRGEGCFREGRCEVEQETCYKLQGSLEKMKRMSPKSYVAWKYHLLLLTKE